MGFYPDNVTIAKAGPLTVYPAPGVPFGLSFIGTAFSEFDLIGFAFAYEQKTQTRLTRKAFAAAIPKTQLQDIVGQQSCDFAMMIQKSLKVFAERVLFFYFLVSARFVR